MITEENDPPPPKKKKEMNQQAHRRHHNGGSHIGKTLPPQRDANVTTTTTIDPFTAGVAGDEKEKDKKASDQTSFVRTLQRLIYRTLALRRSLLTVSVLGVLSVIIFLVLRNRMIRPFFSPFSGIIISKQPRLPSIQLSVVGDDVNRVNLPSATLRDLVGAERYAQPDHGDLNLTQQVGARRRTILHGIEDTYVWEQYDNPEPGKLHRYYQAYDDDEKRNVYHGYPRKQKKLARTRHCRKVAWHYEQYPSCNDFHDLSLPNMASDDGLQLLG